jgi:ribosomal protein S18 acetylase RimI-like enzyme
MLLQGLCTLATSPHLTRRLAQYLGFQLLSSRATGKRWQKPAGVVPKASLTLVAVAPPHRRRGIADQLTRAFLGEMGRRRIDRVKLAVSARNDAALALYAEQGWRPAGAYVTSEGRLAYRLVYELAPPAALADDAA